MKTAGIREFDHVYFGEGGRFRQVLVRCPVEGVPWIQDRTAVGSGGDQGERDL